VEKGGSQFEAGPGKKLMRSYFKKNKPGIVVHEIVISFTKEV
jgi:hypothetical protein